MIEWKSVLTKTRKHKEISVFKSSNIFAVNIFKLALATSKSTLILTTFNNFNNSNKINIIQIPTLIIKMNSILFNHNVS